MLRDYGHCGCFDVNFIANAEGLLPLEITARFGYPATQAQMALHLTPWAEFLRAVGSGHPIDLDWRPGFAVAVLVATPPFPFAPLADPRGSSYRGMPVRFRRSLSPEEDSRVHFESAEFRTTHGILLPVLCDDSGYAVHVTGHGPSIAAARQQALDLAGLVALPGAYYRTDIGATFETEGRKRLVEWGWAT